MLLVYTPSLSLPSSRGRELRRKADNRGFRRDIYSVLLGAERALGPRSENNSRTIASLTLAV